MAKAAEALDDAATLQQFPSAEYTKSVVDKVGIAPRAKKLAELLRVINPLVQEAANQGDTNVCVDAAKVDLKLCAESRISEWLAERGYEAACGTHGLFISWKHQP